MGLVHYFEALYERSNILEYSDEKPTEPTDSLETDKATSTSVKSVDPIETYNSSNLDTPEASASAPDVEISEEESGAT